MNTRIALLNAAEHAVRKRGYNGFSYADLARDVGIRKASIHHHFPTKADLALELIERYTDGFADALTRIKEAPGTSADKLRAYHLLYREALAGGDQLCLCVALGAGRDSLAAPVLATLNQFHDDSMGWLSDIFATGIKDGSVHNSGDAVADASAALALMEGAQLLARSAADVQRFDQATAAFLARLSPATQH